MTPGGGIFRPVYSEVIRRQLVQWAETARQAGVLAQYRDDLRLMHRRLETDPIEWGDPLYRLQALGLLVCRARTPLFYVIYGVDEARRLVHVTSLAAAPGQALDQPPDPETPTQASP